MDVTQKTLFGMLRSGLNLMSQAISIYDKDLTLVVANRRFQTMFSLRDDLVRPGATFQETLTYLAEKGEYGVVEDVQAFVAEKTALARMFEPHYFERTRANGTSISVEGSPLEEGGWITVYTDISEVKRQEDVYRSQSETLSEELVSRSEALAQTNREMAATVRALEAAKLELTESSERLALINRMTPAHIAHVDHTGRYTHSNGRLQTVLPHAEGDIVGESFEKVLGAEVWSHVGPRFEGVLAGSPSVSELRDEASGRYVRLAMTPDVDEGGGVAGAYILSTDVTEEVTARNALAHSRRRELATQLTSVMAHDFSNLLTIIMGQQERLHALGGAADEISEISDTIKSAAKRGADLIQNLNRMETRRSLDPAPVKFSAFVEMFEQLARAALPGTMELEVMASLPDARITLDAGFAQDALLNLVLNASEASDGTGQVSVTITKARDAQLEIMVTDQGPGFTEEALSQALNPFYSTKGRKVGRGLGLTSAFDFAKSCGGTLRIRNAAEGGAQVKMKIPYRAVVDRGAELVLLVDDDDAVRATVRGYLRQAGRTVVEAASVEEAAQVMAIDGLTQVVTDLDIGDSGTGLDVAALAGPDLPVLIITGLPPSDALRQKAEDAHPVLSKPFDFDALQSALGGGA